MGKIYREEEKIEAKFCDALLRRWPTALTRKLNGYGHRDWPDRLVVLPRTPAFYIEFKKPGEELRPSQAYWIDLLRKLEAVVYTCTGTAEAVAACEREYEKSHVRCP